MRSYPTSLFELYQLLTQCSHADASHDELYMRFDGEAPMRLTYSQIEQLEPSFAAALRSYAKIYNPDGYSFAPTLALHVKHLLTPGELIPSAQHYFGQKDAVYLSKVTGLACAPDYLFEQDGHTEHCAFMVHGEFYQVDHRDSLPRCIFNAVTRAAPVTEAWVNQRYPGGAAVLKHLAGIGVTDLCESFQLMRSALDLQNADNPDLMTEYPTLPQAITL